VLIILEKQETIEMVEELLRHYFDNPDEFYKARQWLYHKTDLDYEDLKFKVDVYCRKG
jgi:hypothetical protein